MKLILEDGTPYPLEGKLQFRDVTVDPGTGSVTLRMVFPNPRHILLPGMFVRAVVEEGVDDRAILAMQEGVSRDVKGNAVVLGRGRLRQGGAADHRPWTAAIGTGGSSTGGLADGDRIIVEGLQKVRPGMTVKALPFAPPGASAQAPPAPGKQ